MGIDLYGPSGRLFEVTKRASGDPFYHMNDASTNRWDSIYVPYNSDWTLLTLDFRVPVTQFTQTDAGVPVPPQYATAIIPWMTMDWNTTVGTNSASGWFADAELYINPAGNSLVPIGLSAAIIFLLYYNLRSVP